MDGPAHGTVGKASKFKGTVCPRDFIVTVLDGQLKPLPEKEFEVKIHANDLKIFKTDKAGIFKVPGPTGSVKVRLKKKSNSIACTLKCDPTTCASKINPDDITEPLPAEDLRNRSDGGQGPLARRDSRKNLVTRLQKMLSYLGYTIAVDGVFGERTEEAVRSFQAKSFQNRNAQTETVDWKEKTLKQDALVGPLTSDALNRGLVGHWYNVYTTPVKLTGEKPGLVTVWKPFMEENDLKFNQKTKVKISIRDPRYFAFGLNLAWLNRDYGHDLGANHVHNERADCSYKSHHLQAYFTHMRQNGMRVVRFWVFEGLEGLHFRGELLGIESEYEKGEVLGVDQNLRKNVQDVMEKACSAGLKIYWVILAGTWGEPTTHKMDALRGIVQVENKRKSFIQNGLKPFLNLIKPKRNHVYAIDLINEPEGLARITKHKCQRKTCNHEWVSRDEKDKCPECSSCKVKHTKLVLWDQIMEYVEIAAKVCHEAGFRCSVGFQDPETIRKRVKDNRHKKCMENLCFYDFHRYNDKGTLLVDQQDPQESFKIEKSNGEIVKKACMVGEFGQDRKTNNTVLTDGVQSQADKLFMENSWEQGYAGCLVWYYNWYGYDLNDRSKIVELKHSLLQSKINDSDFRIFHEKVFPNMTEGDRVKTLRQIERPVWNEIRIFAQEKRPVPP